MTGRLTDTPARWADRHGRQVKQRVCTPWSDAQNDFLKEACMTTKSFGQIRDEFNAMFPDARKSRNAIIGRAQREGYSEFKPSSSGTVVPRQRKVRSVKPKGRRGGKTVIKVRKAELAPVVFKDPADLRSDAEPMMRRSGPHTSRRKTPEQIAQARKGHLPSIIEESPLTSVDIGMTEADSCKWPTSEDIRCMEVCGEPAEIGAYCERHAMVAYREMPTKRRNRLYSRRGMIDSDAAHAKEQAMRVANLPEALSMLEADDALLMIPDFSKDEVE